MKVDRTIELSEIVVAGWIEEGAIQFDLDSDASLDAAIDRVVASLGGDVQLLGFGEGLHGGEELLQLRNRIFRRLVAAHGYRAIAIESDFARGRIVSDYVAGRRDGGYAELVVPGFSYEFGTLAANRKLVEWMRAWNADPGTDPIEWHAFDIPATHDANAASPRLLIEVALDLLDEMDIAGTQARREHFAALLDNDADWEKEATWRPADPSPEMLETLNALRIETEELISTLQINLPELLPAAGERRYQEALQHAVSARQVLNVFAALTRSNDWSDVQGVRDRVMAEQLDYIAGRTGGKLFVFAHNAHLQRGKSLIPEQFGGGGNWPAGAHLQQRFGNRYAVIGTALGRSGDNGIGEPEPGSIEALLSAAGASFFFPASQSDRVPIEEIASLPARSLSATNPSYRGLDPQSFSHFDWMLMANDVTAVRVDGVDAQEIADPA